MEYDEVCLNYFLEHQSQLFDENVADSLEEAEAFLEDCMAVICDSIKEVKQFLDESGADVSGMSNHEIEEAEEAGLLESVIQESKRRLQEGNVALTSEVYYEEKSLNGMSRADIEEIVLSQAQIILDELGLHDEVELIGARVYGSRSREGLQTGF